MQGMRGVCSAVDSRKDYSLSQDGQGLDPGLTQETILLGREGAPPGALGWSSSKSKGPGQGKPRFLLCASSVVLGGALQNQEACSERAAEGPAMFKAGFQ